MPTEKLKQSECRSRRGFKRGNDSVAFAPIPPRPAASRARCGTNTFYPKRLLGRRQAPDTFQEWPANELSSIKQAFPDPRLQANMTPRLLASPKSLQATIGETHLSRELARCETIFSRIVYSVRIGPPQPLTELQPIENRAHQAPDFAFWGHFGRCSRPLTGNCGFRQNRYGFVVRVEKLHCCCCSICCN